jgi:Flp pilus assembly protein protease CpaA
MKWLLIIALVIASYFDLKFRKIPNWLTYSAIALSLPYIGAGDIKLAVAIAIWSHITNSSQYWIYVSLILGGLAGLIYRRKSIIFAPFMAVGVILANLARSIGFI